jgi:hypothetical protein
MNTLEPKPTNEKPPKPDGETAMDKKMIR